MPNESYSINVRRVGERYEADIAELSATVTGTSPEEALRNAQREIIQRMIERDRAKKARGAVRHKRTVA